MIKLERVLKKCMEVHNADRRIDLVSILYETVKHFGAWEFAGGKPFKLTIGGTLILPVISFMVGARQTM